MSSEAQTSAHRTELATHWCPAFGLTALDDGDNDCRSPHYPLPTEEPARSGFIRLTRVVKHLEHDRDDAVKRTFELSELVAAERAANLPLRELLARVTEHCVPGLLQQPIDRMYGIWAEVARVLAHLETTTHTETNRP